MIFSIAIIIYLGLIILQIYLSTRENKWLGLILPIICFIIAVSNTGYQIYEWSAANYGKANVSPFGWAGAAAASFFTNNIPTAVLLIIYFACKEKQRRRKALDKMSVQDL